MPHPFSDLLERSGRPVRTIVGLMSGTSADSIDVAVCRMMGLGYEPTVKLLHFSEHAYDPGVKRQVQAAGKLDVRTIAELNVQIGEAFAEACLTTLAEASIAPEEVDLIGSHGQTVYHHCGVSGTRRATLQVGDGDVIAVKTGRYVISDFRARDIAAGGEGAPLSPVADTTLFAGRSRESAIGGRFSISAGSPTSPCSTMIRRVSLVSIRDQQMHRSTGLQGISPAVISHVIMMVDWPGRDG